MTTNITPWSLGSCSNKSLNQVEPSVPPQTASDLNTAPTCATLHAHLEFHAYAAIRSGLPLAGCRWPMLTVKNLYTTVPFAVFRTFFRSIISHEKPSSPAASNENQALYVPQNSTETYRISANQPQVLPPQTPPTVQISVLSCTFPYIPNPAHRCFLTTYCLPAT